MVVGAVARMLRVERCERLTLIAASVRICINSCHESTFYLGVNRQPLLIGDNRVLQVPCPVAELETNSHDKPKEKSSGIK